MLGMRAGAAPLPRATLLAAATASLVATAPVTLLVEGTTDFLFETDAILLAIAEEGRGSSRRTDARVADTVEVGENGKSETYMVEDLARDLQLACVVDPCGVDEEMTPRTTRGQPSSSPGSTSACRRLPT